MRFFLGDASWCHARVVQGGRDATPADVHPGEEQVGPILGDDVVTSYGFADGVTGSYESAQADDLGAGNYFRLELCGTGGILCVWSNPAGPVCFYPRPFALPDRPEEWQTLTPEPLPLAGAGEGLPGTNTMHAANQVIAADLLAAVESGGKPLSSGQDARAGLEMIMAVYASHIQGDRVALPLTERSHPLERWTAGAGR
jgi:predicted dehydrogenase